MQIGAVLLQMWVFECSALLGFVSKKRIASLLTLSLVGAIYVINFMAIELSDAFRTKCPCGMPTRAAWFRHCEDVESNTLASLFGPPSILELESIFC